LRRHVEEIGSQRRRLSLEAVSPPRKLERAKQDVRHRAFADHADSEPCVVLLPASRLPYERHDPRGAIRALSRKPLLEQISQLMAAWAGEAVDATMLASAIRID
jgi:hypothetical protein